MLIEAARGHDHRLFAGSSRRADKSFTLPNQ
jgi:hypothetical protein